MARRRNGAARQEEDEVEWLSGLKDGITLGTSIAFCIRNKNTRPEDYDMLVDCYRPGHADYTWQQKYGIHDHRGGGRASARETVARVVAGAVAKQDGSLTLLPTAETCGLLGGKHKNLVGATSLKERLSNIQCVDKTSTGYPDVKAGAVGSYGSLNYATHRGVDIVIVYVGADDVIQFFSLDSGGFEGKG